MGYKSRSGWSIPVCLRDCRNRDIDCEECFSFSKFSPNIYQDCVSERKLDIDNLSTKSGVVPPYGTQNNDIPNKRG